VAQFDVHVDRVGKLYPLLVDVQADLLARFETRVVVPLAPRKKFPATPIKRLNPIVTLGGVEYVALVQELAAIHVSELGEVKGTVAAYRNDLVAALDLLLTGA
jgi:toxin CcdB